MGKNLKDNNGKKEALKQIKRRILKYGN